MWTPSYLAYFDVNNPHTRESKHLPGLAWASTVRAFAYFLQPAVRLKPDTRPLRACVPVTSTGRIPTYD